MEAFIFVLIVSAFDAEIKGTIMARKEWDELADFWKQRSNLYPTVIFLCLGVLGLMYAFARWDEWYKITLFMLQVLIMGSLGLESLIYWWLLKPLGIKQKAFWKEGTPPATWFDYPDKAPWLNSLFPLVWLQKIFGEKAITRDIVFIGSILSIVFNLFIDMLKSGL